MYATPTFEDFTKLLDWHLDQAVSLSERSYKAISHRRAAHGRFQSGGTIIEVFDAAHSEFAKGVEAALGELKRIAAKATLDRNEMRRVTEARLRSFAERCKAAAKPDMLRSFGPAGPIQERLVKFDATLEHYLRQFDIGFLDLTEPEVPPTLSTSIVAHNVSGVAIQQGSLHSTQHAVGEINVHAVQAAVDALEKELVSVAALADKQREWDGDLSTIKAQLSKSSPSRTIINEAGRSLRNLVENAIGNAFTPPALVNAATALWKAIGLG
jgi:hypothetical protein